MGRRRSTQRALAATAFLALAGVVETGIAESAGLALTIYSASGPEAITPGQYLRGSRGRVAPDQLPGYAVVRETREMVFAKSRQRTRVAGVAAELDPTTVRLRSLSDPGGLRVLEQSYQYDPVGSQALLERFVGHEITVEQKVGDHLQSVSGRLLSAAHGLVIQGADGDLQILSGYTRVRLPSLPEGSTTEPELIWDVEADNPGVHQVEVSYQTDGMLWWSDYDLSYAKTDDGGGCELDLGAWVTVVNHSGIAYEDASIKLIAGDVRRARSPRGSGGGYVAMADVRREGQFREQEFFEYHLYALKRPTSIENRSVKQLELFPPIRGIECSRRLIYAGASVSAQRYYSNPITDRAYGTRSNNKVGVYLEFANREEAGLGMALPAGRVRVHQIEGADGARELIGEDVIDHTPAGEKVRLDLGSAFDVVADRKQTDFSFDTARQRLEEEFELTLRNRKDHAVEVLVEEPLYRWGNWEILEHSHPYTRYDARTIHFPVMVEPHEELELRYRVRYAW